MSGYAVFCWAVEQCAIGTLLPVHTDGMGLKDDTSTVAGMLAVLVRQGGPKIETMYHELIGMGYTPSVPDVQPGTKRQPYLGWADPARPPVGRAKFSLYLEARTVSFGRVTDRRKVSDLPGADTSPGAYVAFRLTEPDGVAHALAAARAVKY